MKEEFVCKTCGKKYTRHIYPDKNNSQKSNYCSKECQSIAQKTTLVGENNPNYKWGNQIDGKKVYKSCKCGGIKDPRANQCASCARVGFGVGFKNIFKEEDKVLFAETVKESDSIISIARKMGYARTTVRKKIEELNLDISHFCKANSRPYKVSEILCKNTKVVNHYSLVRKYVIENKLLDHTKCGCCGIENTWIETKLTMDLHHIDGDNKNNTLENLVFLCPNCHSQTPKFKGRKERRGNCDLS